ncbi:DUF7095 family protein [Halorubrum lacusprofundi]|jgi:hypothetical protein|uniref:Uncharacterized protein n=1 Tax=Halorubrum lacusprofundi (strain ATCC 49239 / DSM 5036 / JCM 8891 / ACAM 34) TaxID=416348 RepID=B9LSX7_HALLT|nr:hypothetical protein [Halorubrum lacusprofundi]ACM56042.1 conserved hypothetical protein [Halorubrum lacusprofundi ATCC 49239]
MDREQAVARLETLVDRVERETMPVPVREVWAFGDVALGLDPVERLDVYLTKDVIMGGDSDAAANFAAEYGVKGVGTSVHAEWAEAHPDRVRTSDNGYAAPEKCLAAELVDDSEARSASGSRAKPDDSEPIHLEVCNASFEDNVRQRLKGALARDAYEEVLDPRGVCLWVDGTRDEEAFDRLREASLAMPTLSAALGMLGADENVANEAAETLKRRRAEQEGASVRGDMV